MWGDSESQLINFRGVPCGDEFGHVSYAGLEGAVLVEQFLLELPDFLALFEEVVLRIHHVSGQATLLHQLRLPQLPIFGVEPNLLLGFFWWSVSFLLPSRVVLVV